MEISVKITLVEIFRNAKFDIGKQLKVNNGHLHVLINVLGAHFHLEQG